VGSFSKQIPLNSDSSLGPVTIGSKIMVERGKDPLPLEGGNVDLVPGSGWDGSTVAISKELNPARNKLDIIVKLAPEVSLAHYINVILKKKPIKLKVTLFPRMLAPGMGVPVNVSAAPVTDDVFVTIPAVPRPDIDLDVKFTGKTSDGSYNVLVTALLKLPPYISKKDRDEVAGKITIDLKNPINVMVEKGELTPNEAGATCELTATPEFTKKGTPSVTVVAKVSLPDLSLKKEKLVSFEPQRDYILNIHPASLDMKKNKAASLMAQVLQVLGEDQKVLVTDARLSIDGGSDLVSCSPGQGTGKLESKVSQVKITGEKEALLTVHATAGTDSVKPQTIPVHLETVDYGSLEVVFLPATKTSLNPYIKTDYVVLRATLVPPPGKPQVKADIEFTLENPDGWLIGPSDYTLSNDPNSPITGPADTTVTLPLSDAVSDIQAGNSENSRTVRFTGRVADLEMKKKPPASESAIVKAIFEGEIVAQKPISITLDLKQTLTASPTEVTFLATAKQARPGRPDAPVSAPVNVSVTDPGDGEWKISVEYEETEKQLVSFKEQDKSPSSEVFLFEIAEKIPRFEQKPGFAPGQQDIKVKTFATLGDLKIEGPVITISLVYEGIYPKSLFEYDKGGTLLSVTEKGRVTINVLDPAEKRAPLETVDDVVGRHMFPYVTFENWEWDGTKLASISSTDIFADPDPQKFKENSPEGDQWYFIFSLKGSEMVVAYSGDRNGDLSESSWHITFQKQIPGKGEEVKGFVRFFREEYYEEANAENSNWYYDLPVTLKLGSADELNDLMSFVVEGGRCEKIIEKCFPEQYRAKLRESLDNLEYKGANDYRVFSWEIHKTAYEIWEKDNQDFLIWDNRWANLINVAEKTEYAGDLAFNAVVMFYTAPLGPVASLGLATIVTEIKTESLAVYSFYVSKGKGADLVACISEYTEDHWVQFITDMAIKTPAELFILRNFELKELLKKPKVYGSMLAWLWLWKFSVHLKEDGENNGGFINSAKKATEEICGVLLTFILADFVKAHGRTNIKKVYKDAVDKGFFGGTELPTEKTDKETKTPEKDPQKKAEEEKKAEETKKKAEEMEKDWNHKEYDKTKEKAKDHSREAADDAANKSKDKVNQEEKAAFERGRAEGKEKVNALEEAAKRLRENPKDENARREFERACEEVQKDKHAMHELNDIDSGKPNKLREEFNEHWQKVYDEVDIRVRERIANELNKKLKPGDKPYTADDIEVVKPTNAPKGQTPEMASEKSTYDRDVTYGNKRNGEDISTKTSRDIYNEEFYKNRHPGENNPTKEQVDSYAKECDQTVTDRYSSDAYGGGKSKTGKDGQTIREDLETATDKKMKGRPYNDVEATANTMKTKVAEWYNEATSKENPPTPEKAEGLKEEGMRQLTKQFDNQVEKVVDKYNELAGYPNPPIAKIPDKVRTGVEIMKKVGKDGFTPADAEAALKEINETPKTIVDKMSGILESGQKYMSPAQKAELNKYLASLPKE
jgi:hypothetical protein